MAGGGTAISAIGDILAGIGQYNAGKAQEKALKAGAEMAKREAGIRSNIALEEGDRVQAHAAVLAAASGGGLTGSAMSVLDDLGRQSMFNARVATYEGVAEANNRTFEAKVAKRQGQVALVSSMFKAGGSFLGSAGSDAQSARAAGESGGAPTPGAA